jgi:hypothetical protein
MKAHVKINVSIQLDGGEAEKYPLSVQYAGTVEVADRDEAERVVAMLGNHVRTTFAQMSVKPATGDHQPDLALAHGGDPEPKVPQFVCDGSCPGDEQGDCAGESSHKHAALRTKQ